jgi:hypothetical protein
MVWQFARLRSSGGPAPSSSGNIAGNATPAASEQIDKIFSRLPASKDQKENRLMLAELRRLLDTLPPDAASQAIQTFLASGRDAPTGLDIKVEAGGGLGDASSLRVFLLDYLGRIDKTAAGKLAEDVLSKYTTPDEWAVSLRNYAWAHSDGDAFLQAKTRQLLENPAWRHNPTAGFLEAFDTIVYSRDTGLTPALAGMVVEPENKALAHAAYLTLDRLTITEPAAVLDQLHKQPGLMKGHELTRANFFARADIADPKQKSLVEDYLLDTGRGMQELNAFAGIYPNENYMLSNNLLTETQTPTGAEIAARDRAALEMVQTWLEDPRFEKVRPQLQTMQKRLQVFVNQANAPSPQ